MTRLKHSLEHQRGSCEIDIDTGLNARGDIAACCCDLANPIVVITDETVASLYANTLLEQLSQRQVNVSMITIPAGERYKNRQTKQDIEDQMLAAGCGRDTVIVAVRWWCGHGYCWVCRFNLLSRHSFNLCTDNVAGDGGCCDWWQNRGEYTSGEKSYWEFLSATARVLRCQYVRNLAFRRAQ